MSGGGPAPYHKPTGPKRKPKARAQVASGWDDVAAARNEVFGDNEDPADTAHEGPYINPHNQGSSQ